MMDVMVISWMDAHGAFSKLVQNDAKTLRAEKGASGRKPRNGHESCLLAFGLELRPDDLVGIIIMVGNYYVNC